MTAYREIPRGILFPGWLNDLRDSSGVYVIRSKATGETLYVGESHSGRLAKTLKRHFHEWNDKTERRHFTCVRSSVEVAIEETRKDQAVDRQNELIHSLKPKHNILIPKLPGDEAPF